MNRPLVIAADGRYIARTTPLEPFDAKDFTIEV
jgi:hypothetical protein